MSRSISVVIPAYSSSSILPELTQRLTRTLEDQNCPFEILFVEDSSPDNGKTWKIIKELSQEYEHVRGFRLLRNQGQHNALLLGIRESRFETIITLDDDLQNPPEEIPHLLDHLEAECADVVYGVPVQKKHGFLQNLGSRSIAFIISSVLGSQNARNVSSFRAFKTQLRNSFSSHNSSRVNIDALLNWGATKYSFLHVTHEERANGESGYTLRKLISHAISMITNYSTLPLRIASITGLLAVLVGITVFLYVLLGKLTGFITEPGFTFLVSLLTILGGAQLLALGIVGEYLATIFQHSLGVPSYTLAERTGDKKN